MNSNTLVDTDVLIWYLRGNRAAYDLVHSLDHFAISLVTHIELVQGMRNKKELKLFQQTLKSWQVKTVFINETISAKALFYVEEYCLSHAMQLADALIAATATEYGLTLITANDKHYKMINGLDISVFRPK